MVHNLITNFDSQHAAHGNKEYADLLWQVGQGFTETLTDLTSYLAEIREFSAL